jgi:glyoxylase-like metal-dependent hydrolase (beta-lactamase superfamily II)
VKIEPTRPSAAPNEVAPGIFRLEIPLPDNPLGTVNAYALLADGVHLIDCGWDTPEAYSALVAQLNALGADVKDIREILVTHIHPDHFGLAGRLADETGAQVLMHRVEAIYVSRRYEDTRGLVSEMDEWLRMHGVPGKELSAMTRASLAMIERVDVRRPDVLLEGGELVTWGDHTFEVLWTPGHSMGLICLYDGKAQVLISGDHVLERISPQVGLHAQSLGNPLADYLDSLRLVRNLPVQTVLPGHGLPFHDLPGRVDELMKHHQERLDQMRAQLDQIGQPAYEVASHLAWRGSEHGWTMLAPFQRRMAVTETVAHLEYMYSRGQIGKENKGGRILYHRLPL